MPVVPAPPITTPTTPPVSVVAAISAVLGAPVSLASALTVVPVDEALATSITTDLLVTSIGSELETMVPLSVKALTAMALVLLPL